MFGDLTDRDIAQMAEEIEADEEELEEEETLGSAIARFGSALVGVVVPGGGGSEEPRREKKPCGKCKKKKERLLREAATLRLQEDGAHA